MDATTIHGAQLIADGAQGQVLIYNGVPGAGNLVGSWSGAAGTDAYGNTYPSGIAATTGTFSGSGMTGADITASTFDGRQRHQRLHLQPDDLAAGPSARRRLRSTR